MKSIKPMKKIMVALCAFGLMMGAVFPVYSDFFIIWVPEKKTQFILGCLIAGYVVGMFGYFVIKIILKQIDSYYKRILVDKLGIDVNAARTDEEDILLVMKKEFEQLLDRFALVMKKEKETLEALSITDGLTSLYNHRYFFEYFNKKVLEGCRSMTVLFCDIDHFKAVNDTYGHLVGDMVLREVGSIIKNVIGDSSCIFRYGGEEFVLVLHNHTADQAFETAEKIRLDVMASIPVKEYSYQIPITLSIGIASYPNDGADAEDTIDKADKAMYCAKQRGRNQTRVYNQAV